MRLLSPRLTLPLAIVISLGTAATLSACSAIPVQGIVEEATGGRVDVGGTTIPDDFPAEVPLPEGEVVTATRVGTGTGKVWNVTLEVTGAATPDGIATLYSDAGFHTTSDIPGLGSLGGNAGYSNDAYGVAVVVTDDGADSYTANFSVTAIPG